MRELKERFKTKFKMKENTIIEYINGSKGKEKKSVGIGIRIEKLDREKGISINGSCSIYSAELFAIDKTIEMAVKEGWNTDY